MLKKLYRKTPIAPLRIKVINYQANNQCNSRCVMCNVWRQRDNKFLTVNEFEKVLNDRLFKYVEHVGITGGEPALIENLPAYFQAAIKMLPKLKGLSLITNSLLPERVISFCREINRICESSGKGFSVMLSLDGLGEINDKNRGVPGSFDKVESVAEALKETNIPFVTGTTITKINVWNLDELLIFLREKNIHGYFRIAEFINRLDNESCEYIRNFDADEVYQLLLFFTKLEFHESDMHVRNTYKSIKSILSGGKRLTGCPYRELEAINLDCHGGIAYCAPKSEVIGNLLEKPGGRLLLKNMNHLKSIRRNYCNNCIHDYHSLPTPELADAMAEENHWKALFSIKKHRERRDTFSIKNRITRLDGYNVFIVGWYGTETVGDKAILGGIMDYYKCKNPNSTFIIGSLYPFVTERTIRELHAEALVVNVQSGDFFSWASMADEVVAGGGPLMELEELSVLMWAFFLAKRKTVKKVVFGCGIGPLYSKEKTDAVKEILSMADKVYLRDKESVATAIKWTGKADIQKIDDPAVIYIKKNFSSIKTNEKNGLACFLRELTLEYRGNKAGDEFIRYRQKFEEMLAANIALLCDKSGLVPVFYSMHNFVVGNDDRDFNFRFVRKYFPGCKYRVENKLSTVENIVSAMTGSRLNLCMRFHSVVFAHILQTPFLAIDYTDGGKIFRYLSDSGGHQKMVSMDAIMRDPDILSRKLAEIL
ncbi:MAG: polysaccharide pyruvyl transferase family protein [Bacillota bacterium]